MKTIVRIRVFAAGLLALSSLIVSLPAAHAQSRTGTNSTSSASRAAAVAPVDPAVESYRFNEARRRDLIARQLDLNNRMAWIAGYGPRYPNPFEPWPRVPGDIWGYPMPQPIEQPIGDETIEIGPDRWLYRPVYAAQVAPVVVRAPGSASTARPVAKTPVVAPAAAKPAPSVPRPAPSDAEPAPRLTGRRAF